MVRRDVFSLAGWAGVLATLGAALVGISRFMFSRVLFEPSLRSSTPRAPSAWRDGAAAMGDTGVPELIVILVIALVVFGPGRLPEIGRSLRAFREATREGTGPAVPEGGRPAQDRLPPAAGEGTGLRN